MDIIKAVFLKQLGIIKDFEYNNDGKETNLRLKLNQPKTFLRFEIVVTENDIKIKELDGEPYAR